jgi:PKD repeat protein
MTTVVADFIADRTVLDISTSQVVRFFDKSTCDLSYEEMTEGVSTTFKQYTGSTISSWRWYTSNDLELPFTCNVANNSVFVADTTYLKSGDYVHVKTTGTLPAGLATIATKVYLVGGVVEGSFNLYDGVEDLDNLVTITDSGTGTHTVNKVSYSQNPSFRICASATPKNVTIYLTATAADETADTETKTDYIVCKVPTITKPSVTDGYKNVTIFVYDDTNATAINRMKTSNNNLFFKDLTITGSINKNGVSKFTVYNLGEATATEISLMASLKNVVIISGNTVIWSGRIQKATNGNTSLFDTVTPSNSWEVICEGDIAKMKNTPVDAVDVGDYEATAGEIVEQIVGTDDTTGIDWTGEVEKSLITYEGPKIGYEIKDSDKFTQLMTIVNSNGFDWRTRNAFLKFYYTLAQAYTSGTLTFTLSETEEEAPPAGGDAPEASFTVTAVQPNPSLPHVDLTFVNNSNGTAPLSYEWDFNSTGFIGSRDETPTGKSYDTVGVHVCKLTVFNAFGSAMTTREVTVTITGGDTPPTAAFTGAPLSGVAPLTVQLTDQSTHVPTTWLWMYRVDGGTYATFATVANPTLTITTPGSYTVYLLAGNSAGSDSETKVSYITVTASDPGVTGYGAPSTLNGYALGGSAYGGLTEYPVYTAGVAGGTYDGSTITNKAGFLAALLAAEAPAVIFIAGNADIDLAGEHDLKIKAGVTLASNRSSTSAGGRLKCATVSASAWTYSEQRVLCTSGSNVRVTGLRMQGECYAIDYSDGAEGAYYRTGLWIAGHSGCIVDNCDFEGFGYANILTQSCPTSGRPWIHHNYIHGSWCKHEAYGVDVFGGDCLIEGNVFHGCRHGITADGRPGERYTARYNYVTDLLFYTVGRAHFDVHGSVETVEKDSGARYDIYNNTFANSTSLCIHQRGKPTIGTYIYKNVMHGNSASAGWNGAPIAQTGHPDFGNIFVSDNYFVTNPANADVYYATEVGIIQYDDY